VAGKGRREAIKGLVCAPSQNSTLESPGQQGGTIHYGSILKKKKCTSTNAGQRDDKHGVVGKSGNLSRRGEEPSLH